MEVISFLPLSQQEDPLKMVDFGKRDQKQGGAIGDMKRSFLLQASFFAFAL